MGDDFTMLSAGALYARRINIESGALTNYQQIQHCICKENNNLNVSMSFECLHLPNIAQNVDISVIADRMQEYCDNVCVVRQWFHLIRRLFC